MGVEKEEVKKLVKPALKGYLSTHNSDMTFEEALSEVKNYIDNLFTRQAPELDKLNPEKVVFYAIEHYNKTLWKSINERWEIGRDIRGFYVKNNNDYFKYRLPTPDHVPEYIKDALARVLEKYDK